MILMDFLAKWGFILHYSAKSSDGVHEEYRSKSFIIDLYNTEDGITCYLLNKDRSNVLDVQPNTDGIFDEWDNYLSR